MSDKIATAVFKDVPDETYAIVVHDASNNDQIDTNIIGIPAEGYEALKNKLPFAAAPKFEKNKFSTTSTITITINIKLRYLL